MSKSRDYELNQAAAKRLREEIDRTYPVGQFVAFAEGKIFADAPDLDELIGIIRSAGKDPKETMTVRAGDKIPDYLFIF